MATAVATAPLRVLVIDDDEDEYILVQHLLAKLPHLEARVDWADSFSDGLERVRGKNHDLYVLDYHLGSDSGLSLLEAVSPQDLPGPVLMVTSDPDRGVDLRAQELGAAGFVSKGTLTTATLDRAIRYAREHHRRMGACRTEGDERVRTKTQFLSHVSHELRSPLASAHQYVTLVLDGVSGPVTHRSREFLEAAVENLDQLNRMIEDLLEVTRLEGDTFAVHLRVVDAEECLEGALESLGLRAAAANVRLKVEQDVGCPRVVADPRRVRQVLTNLLINAIRHSPEDGEVTVRVRATKNGTLAVTVADQGPGLPPDQRESVFERLEQTAVGRHSSRDGLGLGLYISREIIERHGGRIGFDDVTPGAAVTFEIPCFSVSTLVEPVFDRRPSAAVLGFVSFALSGSSLQRPQTTLDHVWGAIRDEVTQDEVLFPRQSRPSGEWIVVLAKADSKRASELQRVLERTVRRTLQKLGRDLRIEVGRIEIPGTETTRSLPDENGRAETTTSSHAFPDWITRINDTMETLWLGADQ